MIRLASDDEAKAVAAFFDGWQDGLAAEVLGENDIAFVERDDIAVVLLSPDAWDDQLVPDADHAGLRIGSWDDGFMLDLQGAVLAAPFTRKMIVRVSEKAAQMFVYGKDILAGSVASWDRGLKLGDGCIVCNPRWEAVGIGYVMGSFKGRAAVISAVHDLGTYLRDQD